jgi:hypothetical protein
MPKMPVQFDGHLGVVEGTLGDHLERWFVMTPFNSDEAMTLHQAAFRAGKCQNTIRNWCEGEGLGRRIGGKWYVSKVALELWLDGETAALARYLQGDRGDRVVVAYFRKFGLTPQDPVAVA